MKLFLFLLFFLTSLLCAQELQKVTLQLKWKHQFQFAGYYAALEKGYYKDAGLDVTIKEATSDTKIDVVSEVLQQNAHFGVGMSNLLLEYAKGKPLVVIGVIFQHSPYSLMSLSSNINTIHDLVGKKVMIEEVAVDIFAQLRREKIDTQGLKIIEHIHNPQDLLDGVIDVMSVYNTNEPYQLYKKKIPYNLFSPREAGIDFYGDNLFTTKEMIQSHPKLVEAFRKASFKGWQYALNHEDEIIKLILKKYNTQNKPKESLKFEAKHMKELIHPDILEIGYMHKGRWEHIVNIYQELGFLQNDLNLDDFLYSPNKTFFEQYQIFFYGTGILVLFLLISWYFVYSLNKKVKSEVAKNIEHRQKIAVSNMVANISHQWKEPLLQISVLNHILLHKVSTAKEPLQKENILPNLYKIDKTITFMSETMQNFLEFYKEEHKEEKFDIKNSIDQTLQLLESKIQKHNLAIEFDQTTPFKIIANKNQIMQVWLNFINNALNEIEKYNIQNPKLQISIQNQKIIFKDNCGGIKNIDRIFSDLNSGLGLKMSKEILSKYNLSLSLENKLNGLEIKIIYKR